VQPSPTASWKDEHETGESGPPKTQAEAAYRHLRRDIRAGLLAPRRWLRLTELRETYGFGWSPLREALFLLTAENLVVAEGQRGFRVAPISEADFDDVLTLRNKLEDEALSASIALGDDAWEAAIVAALHRIRKLPPHWETTNALASEEQQRRHHIFHASLLAACPSRWTLHFWDQLQQQIERYQRIVLRRVDPPAAAVEGIQRAHELIAEEVLTRRFDQAVEALRAHNAWSNALIREALRLEPVE
jgi:GntR family transcriptional regulator, carbon starvation induced regulator